MTKRAIGGLVFFIAVLFLMFYLLKTRSPFGGSNSSFSVDPAREITRIEFTADTQKLFLEKKDEIWLVNGRHETRKSSIFFILKILCWFGNQIPGYSGFV